MAVMEENNVRIKNEGERNFVEKKPCAANKIDAPGALTRLGFPGNNPGRY